MKNKDKKHSQEFFLNPHLFLKKRLDESMAWALDSHQKGTEVTVWGIIGRMLWSLRLYLLEVRFLQGKWGIVSSWLDIQYVFNKYALLYDLNKRSESYNSDYQPHLITYKNLPKLSDYSAGRKENKSTLSLVMIVKNEQRHLAACLNKVYPLVDEIIIMDSGSTDNTQMIAEHYGAKWYQNTDWQGFGKQRQLAQNYATGDYILVLDPDEILDNHLCESIKTLLKKPVDFNSLFKLKLLNIFCGTAAHGNAWFSDNIIRIYANRSYSYHNYHVHESVEIKTAKIKVLNGYAHHFTSDNLFHFLVKNSQYSKLWAEEKKVRQKKCPCLIGLPIRTVAAFLREYIIRGAFLGGTYGFFLSVSAAGYNFNKYLMLWAFYQIGDNEEG